MSSDEPLPPICLSGAKILQNDVLQKCSVHLSNQKISRVRDAEADDTTRSVDLNGYLVLPGLVDLHGVLLGRDRLAHSKSDTAIKAVIRKTIAEAARYGVTTGWIVQDWSWASGQAAPGFAKRFLTALHSERQTACPDLRPQLLIETHATNTGDDLLEAIRQNPIDFVLFRNSLDALLTEAGRTHGANSDRDRIEAAQARRKEVPRFLCRLADAFDGLGIRYGSYGDPDGITRENYSMMGARLCMLPSASSSARIAKAVGDPVLLSASRLLPQRQRFESTTEMLVRTRHCDALVSDGQRKDLSVAAFALANDGLMPLAEAWDLVSRRPARLLGLQDRGKIAEGMRADLVIVNEESNQIEATIANGKLAYSTGAAGRILADTLPDYPLLAAE